MSPVDVLCLEVLHVPGYLQKLGSNIVNNELEAPYNESRMKYLLQKIDVDPYFGVMKQSCQFAALASIGGNEMARITMGRARLALHRPIFHTSREWFFDPSSHSSGCSSEVCGKTIPPNGI